MNGILNTAIEKRKYPRLPMYLPLQYEVINAPYVHQGSIVNASKGGFLIHSPRRLPVRAKINITVLFPKGFELNNFRLVAEIVWAKLCVGTDQDGYQYGLKVVHITDEDEKKLTALLCGRVQKPKRSSNALGFEMRRHPRFTVDYPLEYYQMNSPVKIAGRVVNISERGLGVALRESAQVGQHLKLNVLVESGSSSYTLEMLVQVVWLEVHLAEGWGDYLSGVKIIDVTTEDGSKLRNLIETLMRSHSPRTQQIPKDSQRSSLN